MRMRVGVRLETQREEIVRGGARRPRALDSEGAGLEDALEAGS